ncbi:MAG TPA: methylamine utilization protein MauJ [Candidatus Saccharimonadales bacterium]|nr:methylamine utilization protein MauJ [Candidatus Saccharimonadales bacterium]
MVPVFPHGDAGPVTGSPGSYEVALILGIPGMAGATTSLILDEKRAPGDSLLVGTGTEVRLSGDEGTSLIARMIPNDQGRLAQVRMTLQADSFREAQTHAYDLIMPVLSRIAFEADTALEVTAVLLTETATRIQQGGATFIGLAQPTPELAGPMTPEIRPFLAAYREGLSSNSVFYQALSFYKVVEGVATFSVRKARESTRAGGPPIPDPLDTHHIPTDLSALTDMPDWTRHLFSEHLGLSFREVKDQVNNPIRNAVAHLTPGLDIRIADRLSDTQACRDILPVLRYMARVLIQDELAALPPHPATPVGGEQASTQTA